MPTPNKPEPLLTDAMTEVYRSPPSASGLASGAEAAAAAAAVPGGGRRAPVGPTPLNLKPRSVDGPPRKKRSAMQQPGGGGTAVPEPSAAPTLPEGGASPPPQGRRSPAVAESDRATEELTGNKAYGQ